jgi:WhiB family redox-sensing transcriptional regulator
MSLRENVGINAGDPTRPTLLEGLSIPAWYDDALCAQVDHDSFYPELGGSTVDAKKVCAGCDVREKCLEYALENNERHGVWGGLSEQQRRKLAQVKHYGTSEAEVRQWAIDNGIAVRPTGRIPRALREAFEASKAAA